MTLQPISAKFWLARQTVLGVGALPLVLLAIVLDIALGGVAGVVAVVAVAVAIASAWLIERGRYRSWGYAERDADLIVQRGLMIHKLSVVPYGRMQFIDVVAGPVDRLFGLATVQLHTAAAATDARIPGLLRADADQLRDRLAAVGESRATGL